MDAQNLSEEEALILMSGVNTLLGVSQSICQGNERLATILMLGTICAYNLDMRGMSKPDLISWLTNAIEDWTINPQEVSISH